MRLQALTICINYSDYLRCVLRNSIQFDRWLILTVKGDAQTIELCVDEGIEYGISDSYPGDGLSFSPVAEKGALINEGLRILESGLDQGSGDEWVAIVDADTLLPAGFRERLVQQNLERNSLYGLKGRRVCQSMASFEHERWREPWEGQLEQHETVIGYFNLFRLGLGARYPEAEEDSAVVEHDDYRFWKSFGPAKSAHLPMSALHLGMPVENWRGRVSPEIGTSRVTESNGSSSRDLRLDALRKLASAARGNIAQGSVLQVGQPDADAVTIFSGYFDSVLIADDSWNNDSIVADGALVDEQFLRDQFEERTNAISNLEWVAKGDLNKLEVDVIHLTSEPTYDYLLEVLPAWIQCLKPGGRVVGEWYGLPFCPDTTTAIELLAGSPDRLVGTSGWIRIPKLLENDGFHMESGVESESVRAERLLRSCKCIRFVGNNQDPSSLLLSIAAIRYFWSGPACVFYYGEEVPAVRIACARSNIGFVRLFDPNESSGLEGSSPRYRIGTRKLGFDRVLGMVEDQSGAGGRILNLDEICSLSTWDELRRLECLHWSRQTAEPTHADLEALAMSGVCPKVWVDSDISVVIPVIGDPREEFAKHWGQCWYPPETDLTIYTWTDRAEIVRSIAGPDSRIIHTEYQSDWIDSKEQIWESILTKVAFEIHTEYWVILDPELRALPGANLCKANCDSSDVSVARLFETEVSEISDTGPSITVFNTEIIKTSVEVYGKSDRRESLVSILTDQLRKNKSSICRVDLSRLGWC